MERMAEALNAIADRIEEDAHYGRYAEEYYHPFTPSEEAKEWFYQQSLKWAATLRTEGVTSFTDVQMVNYEILGVCPALLP